MNPESWRERVRSERKMRRDAWRSGMRPEWMGKRRYLFFRIGRILVLVWLFILISTGGLSYALYSLFGSSSPLIHWIWLPILILVLSLPLLAILSALRLSRGFINPLAHVMAAADSVAAGDFSVRVPETGRGEFGRLAQSFNRMVEELERATQLRRNLTADVAHELRTPLHIMQGNLEGILDGVYQPDAQHINLLIDETRRLTRLVEDLRTLSLAEAGQLSLKLETVDLYELLEDTATSFSGQAEAAGVALSISNSSQAGPLYLQADADRLDQVLTNLVANALRHTPSGGKITLSAGASSNEPNSVQIRVADNGSGIPAEDLPFIFDRFWSADRLRQNTRGDVSGLGLPIARQLVQAHGGRISVESQLNQGTTFTITLPIKVSSPPQEPPGQKPV